MQVEVKIMGVEYNLDSVTLNIEDKFGHSLAIELDEINVAQSVFDNMWVEDWADYDVEEPSDGDMHSYRMELLYEYLANMDKVVLTWSERIGGIKLVDVL